MVVDVAVAEEEEDMLQVAVEAVLVGTLATGVMVEVALEQQVLLALEVEVEVEVAETADSQEQRVVV
jgi:hypothetical protein